MYMAGKQLRGVDAERMDALQVRVGVESQQYADEQWKVACADRDIYNYVKPAAQEHMEVKRCYGRCGLLAAQQNVVRLDDLTCSYLHSKLPSMACRQMPFASGGGSRSTLACTACTVNCS